MALGCVLAVAGNGCRTGTEVFPALTHSVGLKNAGSKEVRDASLVFGELHKIGWLSPSIEKVSFRTGMNIPSVAVVKWRRDDGQLREGQVKVEGPVNPKFEVRYHILIHDDDTLSFSAEELEGRPQSP
jgi:hypothetical protein